MIQLFDDQAATVGLLRASIRSGHKASLLVSPTGSGKTVMFSFLTKRLDAAGLRVVLLDHRDELTEQISASLNRFGVRHGIIAAGGAYYDPRLRVHVGSVFTIARRLETMAVPDYVIVDEAHHAILGSTWGKILAYWRERNPNLIVIGVTATPERLSGEGLGQIFTDMVIGPATAALIKMGRLCPYKLYLPAHGGMADLSGLHSRGGDYVRSEAAGKLDKPTITGSAVAQYRKHCNGAPAIAFCASIEHAEHVAETFRSEGFRAASIDGRMDKSLRRERVRDFGNGQLNVLTSCDLVSEGFDVPGIVGAILLRPTQSLALYLQQVGRALRVAPGKERAIILDHVGNSMMPLPGGGYTLNHGFPDDEREWSLEGRERKSKKEIDPDDVATKQCPQCKTWNRGLAKQCREPECGHIFAVKARVVREVEGELAEVDPDLIRQQQRIAQGQAKTIDAMVSQLGYNERRAAHILQARAEKEALQQRALHLTDDVRRACGARRMSPSLIRALKPKQLRELIVEMESMLWDEALLWDAQQVFV